MTTIFPAIRFKDDHGNDFPDWEEKDLKEIASRVKTKNRDMAVKIVLTNSATQGIISQRDYFDKDIANLQNIGGYYVVGSDDFVYNPRISETAPVGPIKRNHLSTGVMSPLYTVFRFEEGDATFFEFYFQTREWHEYMNSVANFGARHDRMAITTGDFFSLPMPFPSSGEQTKIADFLTAVGGRIGKLIQKKALLVDYKKGVMQQLFTQAIRFKDDHGNDFPDWEEKCIGELFSERSEKGYPELELLSVSIKHGVHRQSEGNKRDASNSDKSNYKRVMVGDIAYNSMRMWQGASAVSQLEGLVSPAYTILNSLTGTHPLFYGYLFKTTRMIQIFQRHSQGLTSDTWSLKYPAISQIRTSHPSEGEQTKIANFLSAIDRKIKNVTTQITETQTFKRGLLQQMFV